MKYLRYLALLAAFCFLIAPATKSSQANAQVSIGVGIGAPGYIAPPACAYGYYDYYPYSCAPVGFYGPEWFSGGLFLGAGPWFHGGWNAGLYRGGFRGANGYRGGYVNHGDYNGFHGGYNGGFHGSTGFHASSGFHGSAGFHGSFHGR